MRAALLLTVLLGLATLLVAGLVLQERGGEQEAMPPRELPSATPGAPERTLGIQRESPHPAAPSERPDPDPLGPMPERADERPTVAEAALLFQVLDGRNAEPLNAFEVRVGQRFLRPLLDERGRIRHDFREGRVRCTGLVEALAGEEVELTVLARGFQELRVPALYVSPGRELDLGALRLERAPRIEVRVLDELSGEPVAGARVALLPEGVLPEPDSRPLPSDALDPFRARTDREGRVLLSSRPGTPGTLSVRHADYLALDIALLLPLGEECRETVRLNPLARD